MAGDKSLKYTLLTLAFALTCTLVGSVRLSGADGGGGRKGRDSVLALVPDTSRLLLVSGHTHFVSRDAHAYQAVRPYLLRAGIIRSQVTLFAVNLSKCINFVGNVITL